MERYASIRKEDKRAESAESYSQNVNEMININKKELVIQLQ
jgi:hypothetical protein